MSPSIVFAALLAITPDASAQACKELSEVPSSTQVAWISRRTRRVPSGKVIEVVRVSDLRAWIRDNGADETRMIQGLGMAPRKGGFASRFEYKITIFDVQAEWLCRPIPDGTDGSDSYGVAVCGESDAKPLGHHKPGFTGCGYTLDTAASNRGLDVFRIRWSEASAWGFCVMPLDRFIAGA
jgi:hypothetical protein